MSRVICVFSVHFTVLISFSSMVHLTRLIETTKHVCRSVWIKVSANCCKCKIGQNVGASAFFFYCQEKTISKNGLTTHESSLVVNQTDAKSISSNLKSNQLPFPQLKSAHLNFFLSQIKLPHVYFIFFRLDYRASD